MRREDPGNPISFEEFRRLIASELHVDESLVVAEASFVDNLYADSIRLVEMMLRLAAQGNHHPHGRGLEREDRRGCLPRVLRPRGQERRPAVDGVRLADHGSG